MFLCEFCILRLGSQKFVSDVKIFFHRLFDDYTVLDLVDSSGVEGVFLTVQMALFYCIFSFIINVFYGL